MHSLFQEKSSRPGWLQIEQPPRGSTEIRVAAVDVSGSRFLYLSKLGFHAACMVEDIASPAS